MNASPHLTAEHEIEQIYQQAVARLEKELGWTPQQAHSVIAELAAAHGVFCTMLLRLCWQHHPSNRASLAPCARFRLTAAHWN
jgi:hypothetical protein